MDDRLRSVLAAAGVDLSTHRRVENVDFFTVPAGEQAVEIWSSLTEPLRQTKHWPLLCGGADEFSRIEDHMGLSLEPPESILAAIPDGLSASEALADARERSRRRMLEWLRNNATTPPEIYDALATPDAEPGPAEEEPDFDAWTDREPDATLHVHSAYGMPFQPWESVTLAIVQTANPADAPAYLKFGGFNECPAPAIHVAHLREWAIQYGAVPIAITADVIEVLVARPAQTKQDAWRLARDYYNYCPDVVDQGTSSLNRLANELWRSPHWFFWWD